MTTGLHRFRMTLAVLCTVIVAMIGLQTANAGVDRLSDTLGLGHHAEAGMHFDAHHSDAAADIDDERPDQGAPHHHHDAPGSAWLAAAADTLAVPGAASVARPGLQTRIDGLRATPPDHPPRALPDTIA